MTRIASTVFLGFLAATLTGCSKERPALRPAAGDTVFPVVSCPKTWQAGEPIVLSVKLAAQNENESKPIVLKFEDVPHEPELRGNFVFYKGDDVVGRHDGVLLVPDC
jgi:hypothetical protein